MNVSYTVEYLFTKYNSMVESGHRYYDTREDAEEFIQKLKNNEDIKISALYLVTSERIV